MTNRIAGRSVGRMIAVAGGGVSAVVCAAIGVASMAAGHGGFSGGVGIALIVYGLGIGAAAIALWRGSVAGRGPVLATAVLNVAVAGSFTASAPLAWLGVVLAAATAVAAARVGSSLGSPRGSAAAPDDAAAVSGSAPDPTGPPPGTGAA